MKDILHTIRISRYWLLVCLLVAIMYVITTPRIWQCEGVDEIEYLSLAHSILLGQGYTIYGAPHVLYPPLFATWLSLLMRVFGVTAWRVMYVMNALFAVCGWAMIGMWMRTRFGRIGRWAAWLMLFSYYAWSFPCRFLMTEPIFLPISFGAIILAWRILERNRGRRWEYAVFGLLCLLAGMTRAAAVSLNLALVAAGGVRWLRTKQRAGLGVALLALTLGVGFFAFWSVRADVVNPGATESHWRWAKKYIGISTETEGIIAEGEELTPVSMSPLRRSVFCATRYAQVISSTPRISDNFTPFALLMSSLFLTGMGVHWRRRLWSPPCWYAFTFLSMILMTTWLSNYHRFLFVLAPFLFLFFFEGARKWYRLMYVGRGRWVCAAFLAFGFWGIVQTFIGHSVLAATDMEMVYVRVLWASLALSYFILVGVGLWGVVRPIGIPIRIQNTVAAVVVGLAVLHAGALVVQRARLTRDNYTLETRNLTGTMRCAQWIAANTPRDASFVATIPRLVSFMADREFSKPYYTSTGELDAEEAAYILVTGPLREVPPYRPLEEARLRNAVGLGEWIKVHEAGDAAVYGRMGD